MTGEAQNHWEKHAQQWELVGPPLRPSTPDTECFTRIVGECYAGNGQDSLSALLLGVTPEIAHMDWPDHSRLFAADYSAQMIRAVWTQQDQAQRLAIALQQSAAGGVCVGDVWDNWNSQGYAIEALAAKLGWQPEVIRTIDAYRGMPARYTYPTVREVEEALSPWFDRVAKYNHSYEFGENCPTLVMRRCND